MQILQHPDYPGMPIIVSDPNAIASPKAGAFYVTHLSRPLSQIAYMAYGNGQITATQRINKSRYNMEHCIYRKSASWCGSAKVSGSIATSAPKNFTDWAWISLCNVDKAGLDGLGTLLGTRYQIVWIPTEDGKEPWDLIPGVSTPPPSTTPGITKKPGDVVNTTPGITVPPVEELPIDGEEEVEKPKKAGLPWWLGGLLGLGALTTVIYFAIRDKKNKRKAG